jgi:thiol:disulfide interchange protein DsbC
MKQIGIITTALLLITNAVWAAQPGRKVDAMQQIGATGFQMVESQGQSFFMNQSGRFVIKGRIFDMWNNGKEIASVDQLIYANNHVDLETMGLKMDDLLHVDYGHGPKIVRIFVAPGCPYCHNALEQMKGLEDQFTFQILPLPILGKKSEDAVARLCSVYKSSPRVALDAVLTDSYGNLPKKPEADLDPMKRNLIAAQFLGINSVPVIIASDGRLSTGAPKDLAAHLNM